MSGKTYVDRAVQTTSDRSSPAITILPSYDLIDSPLVSKSCRSLKPQLAPQRPSELNSSLRISSLPETSPPYRTKHTQVKRVSSASECVRLAGYSSGTCLWTEAQSSSNLPVDPSNLRVLYSPPSSPESIDITTGNNAHVSFFKRDGDDGWISWADSPPRPIPALHGPLSLPYARCPSGAEGTIIEGDDIKSIWGLSAPTEYYNHRNTSVPSRARVPQYTKSEAIFIPSEAPRGPPKIIDTPGILNSRNSSQERSSSMYPPWHQYHRYDPRYGKGVQIFDAELDDEIGLFDCEGGPGLRWRELQLMHPGIQSQHKAETNATIPLVSSLYDVQRPKTWHGALKHHKYDPEILPIERAPTNLSHPSRILTSSAMTSPSILSSSFQQESPLLPSPDIQAPNSHQSSPIHLHGNIGNFPNLSDLHYLLSKNGPTKYYQYAISPTVGDNRLPGPPPNTPLPPTPHNRTSNFDLSDSIRRTSPSPESSPGERMARARPASMRRLKIATRLSSVPEEDPAILVAPALILNEKKQMTTSFTAGPSSVSWSNHRNFLLNARDNGGSTREATAGSMNKMRDRTPLQGVSDNIRRPSPSGDAQKHEILDNKYRNNRRYKGSANNRDGRDWREKKRTGHIGVDE